jgi:hypothetical protein
MTEGTPVSPQPGPPAMPPPPDSSSAPPNDPALAIHNRVVALMQTGNNGANWFYWVAGLSLVNSALQLGGGGGIYFVVGLGATLLADNIAVQLAQEQPDVAIAAKALTIGFDLFVALILFGFGWLSRKRYLAVFAIGMALYVLDGLLFVVFQDWMSVAFHAFALYSMVGGFIAYRQMNIMQRQIARSGG